APTLARWSTLVRGAETIVDLGSHVGLFACSAAAANRDARILAVEAFAPNAELLRANAAPFANVTPIEAAIAPTDGRRSFRVSSRASGGYLAEADDPRGFTLDTVSLAELCRRARLETIDLMKVDLEGLEGPLLAGE